MNDTQITMPGFEPPTQEEALRAQREALRRKWEELEAIRAEEDRQEEHREIEAAKGADPAEIVADLMAAIDEIFLMMERGSRPAVIAMIGDKARRLSLKLEAATGDSQAGEWASLFQALVEELEAQDAQEAPYMPEKVQHRIVFTPDQKDPKTGDVIEEGREFCLPDEIEEYRKESPYAASRSEEETPQLSQADTIREKIRDIAFSLEALRDPGGALLSEGIPEGYYRRYETARSVRLFQEVAKQTGGELAQVADKEKRTQEQERALAEITERERLSRLAAFTKSLYMQAMNTMEPDRGSRDTRELAVLYFFATHEDIDPTGEGQLTADQSAELQRTREKISDFCKTWSGPDDGALFAFIEQEYPDPSAAETILRNLPELQGLRPKSHTMPNSKLMNALQTRDLINTGDVQLIVIPEDKRRRQKEITAYTMVSYDPGETSITITETNLSEYERQVSDAVISLWLEADRRKLPPVFTPDMIFRAMPGGGDKPSAQQKGAITKAVEKFRRLHITLDATEEMRKRGLIGERATFKIDNFYLSATHAEYKVKNGGHTVNAYKIEAEPIMLTYSKMTKQILTVPAKYIAIEKVKGGKPSGELIAMTPTRQAMTGYIIRRIKVMQHDMEKARDRKRSYDTRRSRDKALKEKPVEAFRELSPVILFDTLFKDVGVTGQTRDRALDNRNFCFDVLDYQIAVGNISGYRKETAGRTITGVEIIL